MIAAMTLSSTWRLTPVAGALALAACVAPSGDGAPVGLVQAGKAQVGDRAVTVEGQAFLARLAPDAPGLRLTAEGAKPVPGLAVAVTRAGGAGLAFDEGALAKKAARAGCQAAGGQFQDQAIGGYQGGAWLFRGGCA